VVPGKKTDNKKTTENIITVSDQRGLQLQLVFNLQPLWACKRLAVARLRVIGPILSHGILICLSCQGKASACRFRKNST